MSRLNLLSHLVDDFHLVNLGSNKCARRHQHARVGHPQRRECADVVEAIRRELRTFIGPHGKKANVEARFVLL